MTRFAEFAFDMSDNIQRGDRRAVRAGLGTCDVFEKRFEF